MQFSTLWTRRGGFHSVEKYGHIFPLSGKIPETFSIAWKNP